MPVLNWLLNPSGLTAHGFCLSWAPGLVALHVISDALIGLAYFSIPLALTILVRGRDERRFNWMIYLFGAFILACGATHLFSILTLWVPVYGLEGLIKLVTAGLSVATAVILWPLLPKLLAMPTASQLEQLNADLERRVEARTHDLVAANARMTAALADLTRAQAALIQSEAQFRAIFEASPVGKTQTDPATGRIIRANHAFALMLGCEPENLVGRPFSDLVWPDDRDAYSKEVDGGSSDYVREMRLLRANGAPVWSRVSATLVSSTVDGGSALAIAVIEDIDDRHKSELALQAAKGDLEQVVEERTAALVQRDLLIREVDHRVKNNLQIVDGLLVMQARDFADPQSRQAFRSLRNRVYALGLVHHQLMDSKDLQTFDVAPFLKDLSENILEGGPQSGITLTVRSIPLNVGLDFAVPLGLIVTELVTNSLKHAFPDGRGKIEVVLGRDDDGRVTLVVSDNGVGLKESAASPGHRKPALGSGIIKGLVAQLRGTMAVTSLNGARTEIHLAAPVTP